MHRAATIAKHFAELGVIVLLGTLVTGGAFGAPGLAGWLIAPVLILVVRPAGVLLLLARSTMSPRERLFLAWFGVKGIASVYYISFLIGQGFLPTKSQTQLFWTVAFAVMLSILVHGIGALAITRRLLEPKSANGQARKATGRPPASNPEVGVASLPDRWES